MYDCCAGGRNSASVYWQYTGSMTSTDGRNTVITCEHCSTDTREQAASASQTSELLAVLGSMNSIGPRNTATAVRSTPSIKQYRTLTYCQYSQYSTSNVSLPENYSKPHSWEHLCMVLRNMMLQNFGNGAQMLPVCFIPWYSEYTGITREYVFYIIRSSRYQ